MRRVLIAALFVWLAILPVQAQRGGRGGAGGGYRGGGGIASRGSMSPAFHAAPGGSFGVRSQVAARHWGGGIGVGFANGYGRPFHHYPRFYSYYYPYVYAYPYAYYPAYDFGFYDDYYSNNDNEASYAQQQQLNAEIGSLDQQMQELRDENDSLRNYIAERNAPAPATPDRSIPPSVAAPLQPQSSAQPEPQPKPSPSAVLVYKDGRTVEAPNYAIVDGTVWVLSGQRATKIPLSEIDLTKTRQENEKRGVEFTVPGEQ